MKKLLALVLALVMSMSLVTISNAAYSDAADIDYKEAVDVMSAIGVLQGSDGKFNPDGILTRAEACTIITKMLGMADYVGTTNFADAKGHWGESAIAFCAGEGIVNGTSATTFDPNGKLTGYAFAKMLLVTLGYDASIEKMTGTDWTIGVAKLIKSTDLNDGISGFVGSANLSRQVAAKMALNALQTDEVEYNKRQSVSDNGSTSISTDLTASSKRYTFASDYFADLALTNPADDYGRPANKWTWKNQAVGTYPKTATKIYTADMNSTSGKKTVKADLNGYTIDATLTSYITNSKLDTDKIATATANGKVVEIFVTKNVIKAVATYEYNLVTISKVEKDKVTLSNRLTIDDSEDLFATVKGMAKGDKLMVYVNGSTVVEAYAPTTVTGTYTSNKSDKYTVGGEAYEAQNNYASIATDLADGDIGDVFTLTLDKFGYVVDVEDGISADSKTYALVLDTDEASNRGDRNWGAKLLLTDGTTVWADVAAIGGDKVADLNTGDLNNLKNDFVSYEVKDGKYELTDMTSDTKTDVTAITKGDSALTGGSYTASNKTIFVMKNADKTYTVYTGIKNVPSVTNATTKTLVSSGVALVVVVDTFSTTGAKDQVFIYKTVAEGTRKDGSNVIKSYKAIVNGEDTTIEVKVGTSNILSSDDAVQGLYIDAGYTKGYITSADAAVSSTGTPSSAIYVALSAGKDLTLKNGILTVDGTSYVVADSFNSWYITGGTAAADMKADTLTVDKTSTVTDLGITLASGDYVVMVKDSDNYITDLYLFNAVK